MRVNSERCRRFQHIQILLIFGFFTKTIKNKFIYFRNNQQVKIVPHIFPEELIFLQFLKFMHIFEIFNFKKVMGEYEQSRVGEG